MCFRSVRIQNFQLYTITLATQISLPLNMMNCCFIRRIENFLGLLAAVYLACSAYVCIEALLL